MRNSWSKAQMTTDSRKMISLICFMIQMLNLTRFACILAQKTQTVCHCISQKAHWFVTDCSSQWRADSVHARIPSNFVFQWFMGTEPTLARRFYSKLTGKFPFSLNQKNSGKHFSEAVFRWTTKNQ